MITDSGVTAGVDDDNVADAADDDSDSDDNGDGFGDDDGDDIYIMMSVCLFVCNEKSSLPPGSLL